MCCWGRSSPRLGWSPSCSRWPVLAGRRCRRPPSPGYIGSAYFFTSSTSFANPAVTVARAFTDTFAGIAPASVLPFVLAQLVGAVLGLGLVLVLYPDAPAAADQVVVPHNAVETGA
jgi:Major intrinsic protein